MDVFQFWPMHCNFGSILPCMRLDAYFISQDRLMSICYLIRGISCGFYTSSMCFGWNLFWICYLVALLYFHPLLPSALLGSTLWHVLLYVSYAKDVVMHIHSLVFFILLLSSLFCAHQVYLPVLASFPKNEALGPMLRFMELLQVLILDDFFKNNDEMEHLM